MTEHHCEDALAELHRYLDRELDDHQRAEIETHLRGCSPCLEAFDFEAELKRMVAKGCQEQVPQSLRTRVLEALAACRGEQDTD